MRLIPMIMLALLVGCGPGGLRLEEVEDFGAVRSAVWIEWQQERDGKDEVWHEFVLSSNGGLCKDLQELVPLMSDRYDDFVQDVADNPADKDQICNATENFYEDTAVITERFYKRPLDILTLTLRDPDDDREDAPPEDDYEHGVDADDPWFVGELMKIESNPFQAVADAVGNCDNGWENDAADEVSDLTTWYELDGGDVFLTEKGSENYRLELDGDLDDDDGDNAGDILARGNFALCEVTWDSWLEPGLW